VEQARAFEGPVFMELQVEQEDTVYPMVPAGSDLHAMIRRPAEETQEVQA
jgi:acetolactate synthase-1/2/3 large subunit